MIRFIIATTLILLGLFVFFVATLGIYRFKYPLNRIHIAAKCDTLGAILTLSGLAVMSGFNFMTLKLVLILIFMWTTGPVASHLLSNTQILMEKLKEEKGSVSNDDYI
ncbi:MAG: monovalent cation/H(+) antiporter subunit G [Clostridium sp.]